MPHDHKSQHQPDQYNPAVHVIPEEAFDWYDAYAHGGMDRRTFMGKLATLTATGLTLSVLTSALLPNYALAEQVSFNDPDVKAKWMNFDSPQGHGKGYGYLVRPTTTDGPVGAVLVVHENRGLNPYVRDVARRIAKAGFIAFAPDALYPLGGYPGNDDEGRSMQRSMDRAKILADMEAAAHFVKNIEGGNGKLGAVGFCFGGFVVNHLATVTPDLLNAGVPFYGTPSKDREARKGIKAALMVQLGALDARVNASWPDYEADLKAGGVDYVMHSYKGAKHGFHNDSTARYDPENAELAWGRSVEFFKQNLSS